MKQLAIVVSILLCWTTIRAQETSLTYSQVARIGRGHIARIHWSPDGEEIAVASYRGVWFYSVDNMRQGARLFAPAKLNTDRPGAIVLDADWSHVAGFNADGDISVWDINNGVETQTLTDVPFVASHLAFSPDGARLAVAGKSGFGLYNLIDRSWQYTILFAEVDERYRDDLGTIIAEIAFVSDGEIIGITTTDTYVDEVNLKLYLFTQDDGEFLRNRYYNYDETVDLLGDEFPASGLMTRVITQRADFNRDGRAETYFRALFI